MTTTTGSLPLLSKNVPHPTLTQIAAAATGMRKKGILQMLFFFTLLTCSISFTARAAIIPVTNGNDAGTGSLRQALADAVTSDVITFEGVSTVTLTSGELLVDKQLTINGGTGQQFKRSCTGTMHLLRQYGNRYGRRFV